uniref:Translin n=1 Tax=Wuchereria bancrofti TaxID=6293 RepID=A0A1I8EQS5_WUCBA
MTIAREKKEKLPSNATNPVDAVFEAFRELVEKDRILRDNIVDVAHRVEYWLSRIVAVLQKTHAFKDKYDTDLKEVQNILDNEVQKYLIKLAALISPVSYYRYKLCFVVNYVHFLKHGILLSRDRVAELLNIEIDPATGLHLNVEDYLFGVLQLSNELSQFPINAVVVDCDFLYDLDAKFRLLHLKNDGLRRRYDALKYDVQMILQFEIVY